MKHTITVTELSGHNESPTAGNFVTSSNRDFVTRRVTVGVSTLYNMATGISGLVTAVTATRIDAAVPFKPGDLFKVSLSSAWTLQNSDMPVMEVECKICGWSYPREKLINGRCSTCLDEPRPI